MNDLDVPWFQLLADDIHSTFTEGVFVARLTVIETYHRIGQRITTDENYQRYARGNTDILTQLTLLSGVSVRNLRRAIQFYKLAPDLDKFLGQYGKNLTWNHIANELLSGRENEPDEREKFVDWMQAIFKRQPLAAWPADKQRRFTAWKEAGKEFVE